MMAGQASRLRTILLLGLSLGFVVSAAPAAFGVTVDDLALEVRSARLGYVSGETARFELRVTNPTSETFRMAFSSSCQAFFVAEDPFIFQSVLYDFRRHVGCLAIETQLVLEPGASAIYPFEWGFVDDFGRPVPSPQVYRIRASLGYTEALRTATTFVGLNLACSDRLDNDGDGLTDYPRDPGCFGELDGNEFDLFREVVVELRTDRELYTPGDPVRIDISLTNVSDHEVRLNFSCYDVAEQIGFTVETTQGETVFYSHPGICLPALSALTLPPGHTETFDYAWFQEDLSGAPVPYPGQWVIRSWIDSHETVPEDRTSIRIGLACSDGVDNDLDGATDYPDDPECDTAHDNDETGSLFLRIDARGLSWDAVPGVLGVDIVMGDLQALRSDGGDFSLAMRGCLADDEPGTSVEAPGSPPVRQAWFYVGRTVHAGGNGSYDSTSPSQVGFRDYGINYTSYCP